MEQFDGFRLDMRVLSYNIRYETAEDDKHGHGWKTRRDKVSSVLRFHKGAFLPYFVDCYE